MTGSIALLREEYSDQFTEFENFVTRKKAKKDRSKKVSQTGFFLSNIEPITKTQREVFEHYKSGSNIMLHGCAGTGKTFISLYLAIKDVLEGSEGKQSVNIIRSIVPTRDIGFLPGNEKEKSKVYEAPYYAIFSELFGRGDAYDAFKHKNMVKFHTTSFIRGLTLDNAIVIVDEMQNLNFHELDSVITRLGDNCRVIFCGDFVQSDFTKKSEQNGILDFMRIISKMDRFGFVEFNREDIVRSELVKEYICRKLDLGYA